MLERDEEGLVDVSFDVSFTVPYKVANINDDVINRSDVINVAKQAARAEIVRQLLAAVGDGAFDVSE